MGNQMNPMPNQMGGQMPAQMGGGQQANPTQMSGGSGQMMGTQMSHMHQMSGGQMQLANSNNPVGGAGGNSSQTPQQQSQTSHGQPNQVR